MTGNKLIRTSDKSFNALYDILKFLYLAQFSTDLFTLKSKGRIFSEFSIFEYYLRFQTKFSKKFQKFSKFFFSKIFKKFFFQKLSKRTFFENFQKKNFFFKNSCVLRSKEKYWPQTDLKCKKLYFRVKNYEKRTKSANDIVLTAAVICRMGSVISNWWNAGRNLHLTSKITLPPQLPPINSEILGQAPPPQQKFLICVPAPQ